MAYAAGVDVGSTQTKAAIVDERGRIVARSLTETGANVVQAAENAFRMALDDGDLQEEEVEYVVGTGYGRYRVTFGNDQVTEISCHARGAVHIFPGTRTVVDMGGQDTKAIRVAPTGEVLDFCMNDKCAAGTGRFFEAMSRIFRMDLTEFSEISLKAKRAIPVTAQCSVFAETEVISLLAQKNPPADIAAGIQGAVAKRCFTLLKRVGVNPKVTITGGCAKNRGLVRELEKVLKVEIASLSVDPQIIGALGAAVFARRKAGA